MKQLSDYNESICMEYGFICATFNEYNVFGNGHSIDKKMMKLMNSYVYNHFVDYILSQMKSAFKQIHPPQIPNINTSLKLEKTYSDGQKIWLLIAICDVNLDTSDNFGDESIDMKYIHAANFGIGVYSKPDPNIKKLLKQEGQNEGNETGDINENIDENNEDTGDGSSDIIDINDENVVMVQLPNGQTVAAQILGNIDGGESEDDSEDDIDYIDEWNMNENYNNWNHGEMLHYIEMIGMKKYREKFVELQITGKDFECLSDYKYLIATIGVTGLDIVTFKKFVDNRISQREKIRNKKKTNNQKKQNQNNMKKKGNNQRKRRRRKNK